MSQTPDPSPVNNASTEQSEDKISFKHEKDGLSIYITIYNTNNNANQRSEAGQIQKAETGGQIAGKKGQNANQGGQIAEECGQNANQDGEVESTNCGSSKDKPAENIPQQEEKKCTHHENEDFQDNKKWVKKPCWPKPKKHNDNKKYEVSSSPEVE